jgi:tetratricopeptide (TPR) repeat protein
MPAFQRAMQASIAQRPQDAVREYGEALRLVERQRGANDPLAAAMLERVGEVHIQNRQYAEAEVALRRSLAILEGHSHPAVRAEAGRLVLGFDRESVLRKLGWSLWELRRYADSLEVYQRAYDTVKELDIAEADLNRRRAYSSAGIMAAACTQRQRERSDRAMAELKDRMQRVSPEDRRWLEYWVRTGEPRLAARQC